MAFQSAELRQLDQVDYQSGVKKVVLISTLAGLFFFAFIINFPIGSRIQSLVKTELSKLPGCNLSFNGLSFGLFFPKIILTDVQIPGSCFGDSNEPILMRDLRLYFLGPSFFPLGVALKASGDLNGQPVSIRYSTGISSQVIKIDEDSLDLARVMSVIPGLPKLAGKLKLDMRLEMAQQQIQDIKLLAESKDFLIPPQGLGDFRLPRINVGDFSLKLQSEGPRKVKIEQFVLGKTDAPVRANFKGNINLTPANIAYSPVDIKGEAAFSPEFLESFSILNLMLGQYSQKDGFYQIRLGGTLGQMQPMPL